MEMTQVEIAAYRLIFRSGTVKQVRRALYDVAKIEPSIPDELLTGIIDMMRQRGMAVVRELAWPIQELLGKTKSMVLYEVADELGYLELDRCQFKVFTNGKVDLFVNQQFYHPAIEPLVVDELCLWLNRIEQELWLRYADPSSWAYLNGADIDGRLKDTEYFHAPLIPVRRLLASLDTIASAQGRQSLLAIEYHYRSHANYCFLPEQGRATAGGSGAVNKPMRPQEGGLGELLVSLLEKPTACHFCEILDAIACIGRAEPPAELAG